MENDEIKKKKLNEMNDVEVRDMITGLNNFMSKHVSDKITARQIAALYVSWLDYSLCGEFNNKWKMNENDSVLYG